MCRARTLNWAGSSKRQKSWLLRAAERPRRMTVWTGKDVSRPGIDRGPLSAGPVDLSPPTGIPLRHRRLTAACVFFCMEPGPPLCAGRAQTSHLEADGAGTVLAAGRRATERTLWQDMCRRSQPSGPQGQASWRPCGVQPPQRAFMRTRRRGEGGGTGKLSSLLSDREDGDKPSNTIRRGGGASLPTWTREQGKRPDPLLSSAIHASCCQPKFADMAAALGDTHLPLAGICWSARLPGRTYAPPLAQSSLPDVPPRAAMRTTCHAGG